MKKAFVFLLLACSLQLFSKGKLLFVSNIQGQLKLDGKINKTVVPSQYYTFSMIEGMHSVEFFYQNKKVLDTLIQVYSNNQSVVKLNFILPKQVITIEKDISFDSNNPTKIVYEDTIRTNNEMAIPNPFLLSNFRSITNLVSTKDKGYYSLDRFSLDSGMVLVINAKRELKKINQIVNEIDVAVFNHTDNYETYFELIDLDTKKVLHKKNIVLDNSTNFEIFIPKNGIYLIKTTSEGYKETIEYSIFSSKQTVRPIEVGFDNVLLQEMSFASKIESNQVKKEVFTFDFPAHTTSFNYYVSTENNLLLEEVQKRIASNSLETTVMESVVFDSYYNQRFLSGSGSVSVLSRRSDLVLSNGNLDPVKQQMSIGLKLNKPKDKIPPLYVYILYTKIM